MNNSYISGTDNKNSYSFDILYRSIDKCIECIIKKLKKGNICAFIGAGFSKNANSSYPDWPHLLIDAYKEIHVNDMFSKLNDDEIIKKIRSEGETNVAQQYINMKGRREAIDVYIEKHLSSIDTALTNDLMIHKKLLALNWADVITTNWDTLLERNDTAIKRYEVVKNAKELSSNNQKRIVKINGTLRDEEKQKSCEEYDFDGCFDHLYIITESDFEDYEKNHEDFSNFMKVEILENAFCLFGFSGNDPNFRYWIKSLKRLMTKGGKTAEPNPIFMFSLEKEDDADLEQFYHNNYIVPLYLDNFLDSINSIDSSFIYTHGSIPIKERKDLLPAEKFKIIFDYLYEKSKSNVSEFLLTEKKESNGIEELFERKGDNLTISKINAYNTFELFDFSNLKYTQDFLTMIRTYAEREENLAEPFFTFIGNWLTNNYYSLHLLFDSKLAQQIVEKFINEECPKNTAPLFMDHVLRYCRECNTDLFFKLCNNYKDNSGYSNAVYYQQALEYSQAFEYELLQGLLEEWHPEKSTEYSSLYILRKVALSLLFENYMMMSDKYSELDNLLIEAERKIVSDSQLLYFILLLRIRLLRVMNHETDPSLQEKVQELSTIYASPKEFIDTFDFIPVYKKSLRPNEDDRYRLPSKGDENQVLVEKQIVAVRILNFMEYSGCSAYTFLSVEQFIDFIDLIKNYSGESTRTLLYALSYFGNSADEDILRKTIPLLLRYQELGYLVNLFEKVFAIVNYKITKLERNPKIYLYFLYEIVQRCGEEQKNKYVDLFVKLIRNKNSIIIALIQRGMVWGIKKPFLYALTCMKNETDYTFILKWVMEEYLLDAAELIHSYSHSEYENYYINLLSNECFNEQNKAFFNSDEAKKLLKQDAAYSCFLLRYAYEYLDDAELKATVEKYLVNKMNLAVNPFILTKITAPQITDAVITMIEGYDLLSYNSSFYSPVDFIRALNQVNAISETENNRLRDIIKSKYERLSSMTSTNQYQSESIENAKILLFFLSVELNLKEEFVEELKKVYTEFEKDTLSFLWIENSDNTYSQGFIRYLRYCSFTNPDSIDMGIVYTCLARIITDNIKINEAVLEQFINIYSDNKVFKKLKEVGINRILLQIMKKFKKEIPACYDDLFVKKQMQKLAKTMKNDGESDSVIDFWLSA